MPGPRLIRVADDDWTAFCKKRGVWPWYANISTRFLPGAFTHTDGDGVPDEQDTIWVKESVFQAALSGTRWAVDLMYHEWLHNLVPKQSMLSEVGVTQFEYEQLKEQCSHPSETWPAIKHAYRTGFRTNAFTRLLRWTPSTYRRGAFENWWTHAPEDSEAP